MLHKKVGGSKIKKKKSERSFWGSYPSYVVALRIKLEGKPLSVCVFNKTLPARTVSSAGCRVHHHSRPLASSRGNKTPDGRRLAGPGAAG